MLRCIWCYEAHTGNKSLLLLCLSNQVLQEVTLLVASEVGAGLEQPAGRLCTDTGVKPQSVHAAGGLRMQLYWGAVSWHHVRVYSVLDLLFLQFTRKNILAKAILRKQSSEMLLWFSRIKLSAWVRAKLSESFYSQDNSLKYAEEAALGKDISPLKTGKLHPPDSSTETCYMY